MLRLIDAEELKQDLDRKRRFVTLIEQRLISSYFQPIVSLRDGSVYGYEALSRGPVGSDMFSPGALFDMAEKYEMLWELESLCRGKAIETFSGFDRQIKLFLNVNPNIMHDIKFRQGFTRDYLKAYNISPENVVFEITEKYAVDNKADFVRTIDYYKGQNYKIAIDDAGAGYSGLNMISDIRPHFIKIDMNLIRDIDKDVTKQSLIRSMTEFASLSNTFLIAEGVETTSELLKLIDIGIDFAQGFYLGKPNQELIEINRDVLEEIHDANKKKNHYWGNRLSDIFISNISKPQRTISPSLGVGKVVEMFRSDSTLQGVCVTLDERVIGVVTRNGIMTKVSGQYGYNLHFNKSISDIMDRDFLYVDYQSSIVVVSKKAMQRENEKIYDFITIIRDGKYYGIVTVKDLLEKSIEIEVINAKHLNPLSGLPGNLIIESYLENCMISQEDHYVMYIDIDNFKAYNDVYGFENGDRVIKALADTILKNVANEEFAGHIGGDDFIAITSLTPPQDFCEKIINEFDRIALTFYNQNDLDKGYIVAKNRNGLEESFPLISISVVIAPIKNYLSLGELSEDVAKHKKLCKQKLGSNYQFAGDCKTC